MATIETKRSDIRALKGVHLFHFATSNCSQRVRFVLEEKGVQWTSHHVDLIKGENATPEFIALNPKGVVPVLVHDGQTIVESNDIIRYVDERFEGPALSPSDSQDVLFLEDSLQRSSGYQASLKLLSHEFLFKPVRRMNSEQLLAYAQGTQSAELVEFMKEFSSTEGFSRERITSAVRESEEILALLEARLGERDWLTGREFGLTDVSWAVNIHRLQHMKYPLDRFERVAGWFARTRARPGFQRAIARFESRKTLALFRLYTAVRRMRQSSVRQYVGHGVVAE